MRAAVYTLDESAALFFGARYFHLLLGPEKAVGRFGRTGSIRGTLEHSVLVASWHDDVRRGWVAVRFSDNLASFEGDYGLDDDRMKAVGHCMGVRKPR